MGFAEASPRAYFKERRRKSQTATIAFGDFHLRGGAFSAPFSSDAYLPKKRGRENFGLFPSS